MVIAKSLLASLEFHHHLILGISVWLSYSADRFFEPSQLTATNSRRHEIFKIHKIAFIFIWFFLLFLAVFVSLIFLPLDCFLWGIPLFVMSVSNLVLCLRESCRKCHPRFQGIENSGNFCSGLLFFPAYESFQDVSKSSMTLAVIFYLLFINCLSTSRWELVNDERNGSLSFLQRSPRLLAVLSGTTFFAVLILAVVLVFGLGMYLEIFLLIHALTILAFVLWLEEISFLAEDDKRKAIDLRLLDPPAVLVRIAICRFVLTKWRLFTVFWRKLCSDPTSADASPILEPDGKAQTNPSCRRRVWFFGKTFGGERQSRHYGRRILRRHDRPSESEGSGEGS